MAWVKLLVDIQNEYCSYNIFPFWTNFSITIYLIPLIGKFHVKLSRLWYHFIIFIFSPYVSMCRDKYRSSHPEMFFGKDVLKICSKFTGEHTCRSVIPIKLQSSFIEITLWHWCSVVYLLDFFRTSFSKKTSAFLLLLHLNLNL